MLAAAAAACWLAFLCVFHIKTFFVRLLFVMFRLFHGIIFCLLDSLFFGWLAGWFDIRTWFRYGKHRVCVCVCLYNSQ